jgi:hypothetical protein
VNRVLFVVSGVCLVVSLWGWMLLSIGETVNGWWAVWLMVSKIVTACFITAPVYREYLK